MEPVEKALRDAKFYKGQMHNFVLVEVLLLSLRSKFFCGKELIKCINPNEAVASRVTKLTSIFSKDKSEEVQDLHLDVVSLPLELKLLVVSWHH